MGIASEVRADLRASVEQNLLSFLQKRVPRGC